LSYYRFELLDQLEKLLHKAEELIQLLQKGISPEINYLWKYMPHHTRKKKWTHYFWEFLMLFLAVFCGFMAENLREHQVEHKREKTIYESLMEDLVKDIDQLQRIKPSLHKLISRLDSIEADFGELKNGKPAITSLKNLTA
jgi:hypothetical protein